MSVLIENILCIKYKNMSIFLPLTLYLLYLLFPKKKLTFIHFLLEFIFILLAQHVSKVLVRVTSIVANLKGRDVANIYSFVKTCMVLVKFLCVLANLKTSDVSYIYYFGVTCECVICKDKVCFGKFKEYGCCFSPNEGEKKIKERKKTMFII